MSPFFPKFPTFSPIDEFNASVPSFSFFDPEAQEFLGSEGRGSEKGGLNKILGDNDKEKREPGYESVCKITHTLASPVAADQWAYRLRAELRVKSRLAPAVVTILPPHSEHKYESKVGSKVKEEMEVDSKFKTGSKLENTCVKPVPPKSNKSDPPAVHRLPIELLWQIYGVADPVTFHNLRRVCRGWYLCSLDTEILRKHLLELGYNDYSIQVSDSPRYLSMRLSRECALGAAKDGKCEMAHTKVIDLSDFANSPALHVTISSCGRYALICEGYIVYIYYLHGAGMKYVTSVVCPRTVLAVSVDASHRASIAILMEKRMGMFVDNVIPRTECWPSELTLRTPGTAIAPKTAHTYFNLCSEEDPPRSVAICPQRRVIAFGAQGGIEVHWVDAVTKQDLNRWFPLNVPSDYLYFLSPKTSGPLDSTIKMRLISSAVHPDGIQPVGRRFGARKGNVAWWQQARFEQGSQCKHFAAVPVDDGRHILFTDPEDSCLYLGGNVIDDGPMRLLQRIKLTPPSVEIGNAKSTEAMHVDSQIGPLVPNSFVRLVANGQWSSTAVDSRPSVYASGHDTRYGIRVVAAYGNRLVLYSIPPATLVGYDKKISAGGIQDDRSPTDLSVTLGYHPSHAYIRTTFHTYSGARPDSTILGSEIAVVEDLVEVAIDSGPNMTVYAFSSKGFLAIYRLDGLFEKRAKVVWEKLGPRDETSLDPDCKALKENGIEHFEKKEVEKCFRGNTPLKPSAIFEVLANETTYFEGGLDGRATFPLQSTCDYDLLRPPGRDSAENRNHAIEGVKNKEKRKNWITADSATSSSLQQGRLETAYDYYYANLGRTVEIDAICFDEIGIDRDCVDDYDQQEGLLHDWYLGGLGNMRKSPGGCPFRLRRTNALQRGLGIGDIDFWDEESNASSGESWSKIGAGRAGRRWVRLECEVMGL